MSRTSSYTSRLNPAIWIRLRALIGVALSIIEDKQLKAFAKIQMHNVGLNNTFYCTVTYLIKKAPVHRSLKEPFHLLNTN